MACEIDPLSYIITIPKSFLTNISGTIYELDTNQFRLNLRGFEDNQFGITYYKTHDHNTEVTVAGITYARVVEILPPWSVEFEDGQYTVILVGSNNNIFDVASGILEQNQVQVIPTNAAGLIVSGSGVTTQDKTDIIEGTRAEMDSSSTELAGIRERTDNLPNSPADVSDVPTAQENAIELLDNQTAP